MKLRYLIPALCLSALPLTSPAAIDLSINIGPPVLPVYEQPPCPTDGYLWTPGYYAYGDGGYYYVPGVWVAPPQAGFLWTPGYWGFNNGAYVFNEGYWGPTVGFYGGINYGFGYGGNGYYGGRWNNNHFEYNTAITRVNTTVIHNTYIDKAAVARGVTNSRASFNGPGGVTAKPTAAQLAAARQPHVAPTAEQLGHRQEAASNPANREVAAKQAKPAAAANPAKTAAAKPGKTAADKPGKTAAANTRHTDAAAAPHPLAETHATKPAATEAAHRQPAAAEGRPEQTNHPEARAARTAEPAVRSHAAPAEAQHHAAAQPQAHERKAGPQPKAEGEGDKKKKQG